MAKKYTVKGWLKDCYASDSQELHLRADNYRAAKRFVASQEEPPSEDRNEQAELSIGALIIAAEQTDNADTYYRRAVIREGAK